MSRLDEIKRQLAVGYSFGRLNRRGRFSLQAELEDGIEWAVDEIQRLRAAIATHREAITGQDPELLDPWTFDRALWAVLDEGPTDG